VTRSRKEMSLKVGSGLGKKERREEPKSGSFFDLASRARE